MTGFADLVRLVGLQPVQRVAVFVRKHGDRPRTEFVAGAERPDRDLSAVGHQNLAEHARSFPLGSVSQRTLPGSSRSAGVQYQVMDVMRRGGVRPGLGWAVLQDPA